MIIRKQAEDLKALFKIAAGKDKGRGLPGGEKPAMGVPLPSAELGERPVEVCIVDKKGIQNLGPDMGNERQDKHNPFVKAHSKLADDLSVEGMRIALVRGRYFIDARVCTLILEIEGDARLQHPVEPRKLTFQTDGVFLTGHHDGAISSSSSDCIWAANFP